MRAKRQIDVRRHVTETQQQQVAEAPTTIVLKIKEDPLGQSPVKFCARSFNEDSPRMTPRASHMFRAFARGDSIPRIAENCGRKLWQGVVADRTGGRGVGAQESIGTRSACAS